ncbi:hypothetical protein BT69DRAFT_1322311 [Atractiella rhizophila]|nr:hypothetical protein BT69DRAFT_1322311 [Atractiella rhizophila]
MASLIFSTLLLGASHVAAQIGGAYPPPDGMTNIGVDPELASLIGSLQNAPTSTDREYLVLNSGNTYVYDFINSPLTGPPGKGGAFTLAYAGNYPAAISNNMAGAFFMLAPCGMIAPHTHPRGTEVLYLIAGGPMRFGINFEAGGPTQYEFLQTGQAVMLPQGSMHYGGVLGCDPTVVIAMFNSEDPGFMLTQFAFFGFDEEAIQASLGTIGALPVDPTAFPLPLNLGFESCLQRCGITQDYDISGLSKLQVMQAAFAAYAARVASGNLSTFTPGAYDNGPQDYAAAVPQLKQVPGAATIGNVSAIFADGNGGVYVKPGAAAPAPASGSGSSSGSNSGSSGSGSTTTTTPATTNSNTTAPAAAGNGTVSRISGFAADNEGSSGGDSGKLKSYKIATYTLAGITGLFLITTLGLLYTLSKGSSGPKRPSTRSRSGPFSSPLLSREQPYDRVEKDGH